ncbi:MAG: MBL fold metallo-hydrolase [Candidatus Marinimicrobia bacterium]|nr:MBL fold metallo-hydrolase [Candidatus Neomarinimicrobiota bacterium]
MSTSMRLFIGGARGSSVVADPACRIYGGDTTALLLEHPDGGRILIDAGSGLRLVERRLAACPGAGDPAMLMTHYHLDHLLGFPSFSPIYRPGTQLRILGPAGVKSSPASIFGALMSRPFWPLELGELRADLQFEGLNPLANEEPLRINGFVIRWFPLAHPGGCLAYRISLTPDSPAVVIATDYEWDRAPPQAQAAFVTFCRTPAPPALLLMDGHYRQAELAQYRGWGHSSSEQVAAVARAVGAAQFLVTHHAPLADDVVLAARERELQAESPRGAWARQGTVYAVTSAAAGGA